MKDYKYNKCKDCGIKQRHFLMIQVGVKGKYEPVYLCFDCWVKRDVNNLIK